MIYQNSKELRVFLEQNRFRIKKNLGQNFLVNREILKKIITAAQITKKDFILEIGSGLGILTEELAKYAKKVKTIEVDASLVSLVKNSLKEYPNIEIEENNALQTTLPTTEYKLVANIPYYITSPLLSYFLQPTEPKQKRPSIIVLLIQKEVAEKICAPDGDHSILSLSVQIFGKPAMMGTVGKNNFFPQPQIESEILKIEVYQEPLTQNPEAFFHLIKAAFSQKRKTLFNSLQNNLKIPKEQITILLQKSSILPGIRPQMLTLKQWNLISKNYTEMKKNHKEMSK